MVSDAECVLDCKATLGEGAVWCDRTQALYWVDILAPALHRYEPASGKDRAWLTPEPVGTVALGPAGRVVVALASGLAWFDPETDRLDRFLPIEDDQPNTRLNDGRCDHQGRLWVGSMSRGTLEPVGVLYRCTAQAAIPVRTGIQVPNCTAFSPDGHRMYFTDTPTRVVRAFDLEPETGELSGEREFASFGGLPGLPDGATIDAEGGLWVAHWEGGRVSRFTPDGKLDRCVRVAASRVTCCAFGGPDLGSLFITTARHGLDAEAIGKAPLSGGLFVVRPGVEGLPEPRFRAD